MHRPITPPGWLAAFALLLPLRLLSAHPIPDVPVRGFFHSGGAARVEIEIDPRCFTADPLNEPYLIKQTFDAMPDAERARLLAQAAAFASRTVSFHFFPMGRFVPDFEFTFGGQAGTALEKFDDPVMITGRWTIQLAAGLTGYRVDALAEGDLSVVVVNQVDGEPVGGINVLFPGESSNVLDLTRLTNSPPVASSSGSVGVEGGAGVTFTYFLRQGFVHVAPRGLDHILFMLGLFQSEQTSLAGGKSSGARGVGAALRRDVLGMRALIGA